MIPKRERWVLGSRVLLAVCARGGGPGRHQGPLSALRGSRSLVRLLTQACSVALIGGLPGTLAAQSAAPPAPAAEFTVRPGDVLRIRVWPDTALGGEFPVEESGLVYLPILGAVQAGGLALSDLRRVLRDGYGQAMKAPVVTVTPLFRVSVLGAVERPGLYQVDPAQTLFDAISLAGGFRENAKEAELRVIRGGRVLEVNAKRALQTGEAALAINLQSGDRIVVPERGWRLRASDVLQLLQSVAILVTLFSRF